MVKVPFQVKNLGHYFFIEMQLIVNVFRFIKNKMAKQKHFPFRPFHI